MREPHLEGEAHEVRLKRLKMRSWRRGTKEMDLILGPFADRAMAGLSAAQLDALEDLMGENDQELYAWITGSSACPDPHLETVQLLRVFHDIS